MKKFLFAAAIAIVLAAFIGSCTQKKEETKVPEGTPIGALFLVTKDDSTKVLKDSTGYGIGDIYTDVSIDSNGFIVAVKQDGDMDLMTAKGATFAHCTEYSILPYYQTTDKASDKKFVATTVGSNGNHLAFDFDTQKRLVDVEGIKDVTLPLDNGYVIFKIKGKWGVAKQDASEPLFGATATAVGVVTTTQGRIYFYIQNSQGSGLYDEKGDGIKYATPKTIGGKELWKVGSCFARVVNNI